MQCTGEILSITPFEKFPDARYLFKDENPDESIDIARELIILEVYRVYYQYIKYTIGISKSQGERE